MHDVEQGSPAWHEARRGRYTGSNAHKLLGSFGATEYAKAVQDSFRGNFHTKRGHLLESDAIRLYEMISKEKVQTCGYVLNNKYPTALYSPDGLTDTHVIEVKCFSKKEHLKIYNGELPLKILAQIYFGMLICERKAGKLLIYNPDFAKQEIDGSINADYDPKKAFKIIDIKYDASILRNFKRILTYV